MSQSALCLCPIGWKCSLFESQKEAAQNFPPQLHLSIISILSARNRGYQVLPEGYSQSISIPRIVSQVLVLGFYRNSMSLTYHPDLNPEPVELLTLQIDFYDQMLIMIEQTQSCRYSYILQLTTEL